MEGAATYEAPLFARGKQLLELQWSIPPYLTATSCRGGFNFGAGKLMGIQK